MAAGPGEENEKNERGKQGRRSPVIAKKKRKSKRNWAGHPEEQEERRKEGREAKNGGGKLRTKNPKTGHREKTPNAKNKNPRDSP